VAVGLGGRISSNNRSEEIFDKGAPGPRLKGGGCYVMVRRERGGEKESNKTRTRDQGRGKIGMGVSSLPRAAESGDRGQRAFPKRPFPSVWAKEKKQGTGKFH